MQVGKGIEWLLFKWPGSKSRARRGGERGEAMERAPSQISTPGKQVTKVENPLFISPEGYFPKGKCRPHHPRRQGKEGAMIGPEARLSPCCPEYVKTA